jgi:hypothetical protein
MMQPISNAERRVKMYNIVSLRCKSLAARNVGGEDGQEAQKGKSERRVSVEASRSLSIHFKEIVFIFLNNKRRRAEVPAQGTAPCEEEFVRRNQEARMSPVETASSRGSATAPRLTVCFFRRSIRSRPINLCQHEAMARRPAIDRRHRPARIGRTDVMSCPASRLACD